MKGISVAEALNCLVESKVDYKRLIEAATYDIGIYRPDRVDPQTPHTRDELYIVGSGAGQFIHAGETKAFGPGDLFFVRAGAEHRFMNFSNDFSAWVVFFGPRLSN